MTTSFAPMPTLPRQAWSSVAPPVNERASARRTSVAFTSI